LTVFIDTSALVALLDAEDVGHDRVFPPWRSGIDDGAGFVTTNYVLLETIALVQRRLGVDAVRILVEEMLPMIDSLLVAEADHSNGLSLVLMAARRRLSLVDCLSFTVMRRLGIREYLGLDPHFEEQGFTPYAPTG
jgi:predicted nucleic acid-binding protein